MNAAAEVDDLEALFDQVAAQRSVVGEEKPAPAALECEDLETLFDQVAGQSAVAREGQSGRATPASNEAVVQTDADESASGEGGDMFQRVGHLTRTLHDALRELGYDRNLEKAVQSMPDARDRLTYIATLTGQAAERALGSVERAQVVQQSLEADAARLSGQWEQLYAGELSVESFKRLAQETREHLAATPQRTAQTRAELHEIMMAQDFHDLTGQVINRVITLAQGMEAQLVKLLVEARPAEGAGGGSSDEWLTGPAINAEQRSDVVANQAQVDDLLESLGF